MFIWDLLRKISVTYLLLSVSVMFTLVTVRGKISFFCSYGKFT